MTDELSAFLSASANEGDREVVEWFSLLLKEHGIAPIFSPDRPEPRPPQEKIEDFIAKSNMFVAVITRRDRIKGKGNLWKGPAWVQNELAMAYALKKPIAVFVEKEVQLEPSIAPFITDCVRFDRRGLDSIRGKAESFIEALRSRVQISTRSPVSESSIDETLVEDFERGAFETVITRTGRAILLKRYKRLDVSLRNYFTVAIIATLILLYIGYDSILGTKAFGAIGASLALFAALVLIVSMSITNNSKCKKCKSYFSKMQRPVTYGDAQKFKDLSRERKLSKHVCEVCGDVTYSTEKRETD